MERNVAVIDTVLMRGGGDPAATEIVVGLTDADELLLAVSRGSKTGFTHSVTLAPYYAEFLRDLMRRKPDSLRMADATDVVGSSCLWFWSDARAHGALLAVNLERPDFTEFGHRSSAYKRGMQHPGRAYASGLPYDRPAVA